MPVLGTIIKSAIDLRGKVPKNITRANPDRSQRRTLKKLIRKAQLTAFGEYYDFSDLLREKDIVKAFMNKVPVHDYNAMHQQWWFRALNGEPYVCWPGQVKYFALSSGTSEASSKYIPVTGDMLRAIKRSSIRQLLSLARFDLPEEFYEKGILMLGGSTHLQYNGTYYEGDLSGISASNIPFWFQHHYKPGKRISKERDWNTKLEEIIRKAPEWDIGMIVGVPAWLQILTERILERYGKKNIHEIWPNLSMFVHGGVSFTPYVKGFEKLLGRPITYIETYLASEGFIAFQTRPDTSNMQLIMNNGLFYEFIPFNEDNFDDSGDLKPDPEVVSISNVKEGSEYALLLSTCAGSWRYLIGDTIKFTDKEHCEIVITGRTKHFLNLCGEHLSLDNMTRAIRMLGDEFDIEIREFAVAGQRCDSMFGHKWYLGIDCGFDNILAAEKIDEYLKKLNDDYRVERIAAIKDVTAEVLPTNCFYDYMRMIGKEGGQNKFPRVMKTDQHREWQEFINVMIKA